MRILHELRSEILDGLRRLSTEIVSYRQALGRVAAESLVSPADVPPFPNSAMDGFAVRSEDVATPGALLEIVADVPAGQVADVSVGTGQAIRIMTGAPMPEGADTVVRVEETAIENGKVRINTSVGPGNHVREPGGDIRAGDEVVSAGTMLNPMHIGVLATVGAVEVTVSRRPRVAVMSTGDELQAPETPDLGPGMIRDSNRPMLMALLEEAGAQVVDLGSIVDDVETMRAALREASQAADVIVTSGGVSMGDYDVIKLVLRDEADVDFVQLAMKPGKPLGVGHVGGKPFFGLPGNPVSVMVSFEQLVRPSLLRMQGARAIRRPRVEGVAAERLVSDPAKTEFVRVRFTGPDRSTKVVMSGGQGSNVLSAAASADAFAVVPRGVETVEPGEPVTLELFRAPAIREALDDD